MIAMQSRTLCFISIVQAILGSIAASSSSAQVQDPKAFGAQQEMAADIDWPQVGNDSGGRRCSDLRQINKDNVRKLQVAWVYHTRDAGEKTTIECTPIVIGGVMYITTARTKIVALNAATGQEIWQFDPYSDHAKKWIKASGGVNRGVALVVRWPPGRRTTGFRRVIRWTPYFAGCKNWTTRSGVCEGRAARFAQRHRPRYLQDGIWPDIRADDLRGFGVSGWTGSLPSTG